MTELFDAIIEREAEATVFPVREYWQDMGQKEDFRRANGEYEKVFE
jgi:NDP-sugar pyrophosphorylase family protein